MMTDPWEFFAVVNTMDEVDKFAPIKLFPRDLPYLKLACKVLQNSNQIAFPKSRRMKISWLCTAFILWDTIFNAGRRQALVSKKEDDSDALVERCYFMLQNLNMPKDLLPKAVRTQCLLKFPELNSEIGGYPSGADQLRQYTFSNILGDECAFWDNAQKMYSASYPTIEGGGRIIMVSSVAPGFFKRLVFDRFDDDPGAPVPEMIPDDYIEPITGMKLWRNRKNRFNVVQLHYTCDEKKRDPKWAERMRAGMPAREWAQEYELNWETYDGLPVYGDWNPSLHISRKIEPAYGLPLLRGWDWGLTPACIICQLQGDQLVVLREITATNMGADRFSTQVLETCRMYYPQWGRKSDWLDFIDPAGMNRDQSNEGSCARILDTKGLLPIAGPIAFEDRRKAVEHFLCRVTKGIASLVVNDELCPILVRGFNGGYRYPERALIKEPDKLLPLKDEHSHIHDAFQYVCGGILFAKKSTPIRIPSMRYSR